jgi:hypothetical protein
MEHLPSMLKAQSICLASKNKKKKVSITCFFQCKINSKYIHSTMILKGTENHRRLKKYEGNSLTIKTKACLTAREFTTPMPCNNDLS